MGRPEGTRKGVINLIPGLRFRDKVREGLRTMSAPMTVQETKTGYLKVSVLSHKSITSKQSHQSVLFSFSMLFSSTWGFINLNRASISTSSVIPSLPRDCPTLSGTCRHGQGVPCCHTLYLSQNALQNPPPLPLFFSSPDLFTFPKHPYKF